MQRNKIRYNEQSTYLLNKIIKKLIKAKKNKIKQKIITFSKIKKLKMLAILIMTRKLFQLIALVMNKHFPIYNKQLNSWKKDCFRRKKIFTKKMVFQLKQYIPIYPNLLSNQN